MTFRQAVESTEDISASYCVGLQALKNADRAHLSAQTPRLLAGSVDLDRALAVEYPHDPRWDYAIGHRPKNLRKEEMIYWVEIHPATEREIKNVIAKLRWLKTWLRDHAPNLNRMRCEFLWLSSGRTSLSPSAPQRKRMAQHGLLHRGRRFTIPDAAGT